MVARVPMPCDAQPYPVIATRVDPRGDEFRANHAANTAAIDKLRAALHAATVGGGDKYTSRHIAAGKLLPRARIELLLDRDSHFLELCALAGRDVAGHTPGAGFIGGVGRVSGVDVVISANDATVKGGAMSELTAYEVGPARRRRRAQPRLPTVSMIESAGADLPNQAKIFVPGGRGFRDLTRRSEMRIPSVCLVFGSSTGGRRVPAGYERLRRDGRASRRRSTSPARRWCRWRPARSPTTRSSAARRCTRACRASRTTWRATSATRSASAARSSPTCSWTKAATPAPARAIRKLAAVFDAEDLLGIVSPDVKVPFDAREVIARIVDGSRLSEFKPLYGSTLVCGWAHLHGHPIGVLANNGILMPESAQKGAQFIALCNQSDVPLVFLQNITGFMVGKRVEQDGIIKEERQASSTRCRTRRCRRLTVMIGASYGAGNYAMCGRAYAPRFLFTWPNHRIAVMGGKQLAGVLDIIQREAAAKRGEAVDEQKLAMSRAMVEKMIETESDPYFATARLWDDGIIDPRDTRTVLAIALTAALRGGSHGTTSWGVYRH